MINGDINKAGLQDAIKAAGFKGVVQRKNTLEAFKPSEEPAINDFIAAYDELPATRLEKITELKKEGLKRVQSVFPAIHDFNELDLVREQYLSVAPAARQPTDDFQKMIDLVQAGKAAVVIINSSILADVINYDVITDPAWPV